MTFGRQIKTATVGHLPVGRRTRALASSGLYTDPSTPSSGKWLDDANGMTRIASGAQRCVDLNGRLR